MLLLGPVLLLATSRDFGSRLWSALPTDRGNVVVSPISIEACLGLLIPAVGPASRAPLAKTLGTTTSGLGVYQAGLQKRLRTMLGPEVTIANAGFFGATPRPAYQTAIAKGYGATVQRLSSDPLPQVNGWVNAKTKGRIPKLFDHLNPRTTAVFLNAITFDGDWSTAFPKAATTSAPFLVGGTSSPVSMMRLRKGDFAYGEGTGFQVAQLRYRGDRYQMTIILPKQGDPAHFLSDNSWRPVPLMNRKVDLSIPKFTLRSIPPVQQALGKMGLAPLYAEVDLRPALASGAGSAIDQVVHQTYVKVDETGTQAAAATGIAVTKGEMMVDRPLVFRADHPFAFVIQHVATGEILFEGVVRKP